MKKKHTFNVYQNYVPGFELFKTFMFNLITKTLMPKATTKHQGKISTQKCSFERLKKYTSQKVK